MLDLFTCDLDCVTLSDVKAFLAMSEPEADRLPEGTRVDYKSAPCGKLPKDLSKHVAGFANQFGGLLFVGVEESQGLPCSISGVERRSELKTKLSNILRTSVMPTPKHSIHVIELQGDPKPHDLGILRIEEGLRPPYMTSSGIVPIRRNDQTSPANLLELDQLYEKRKQSLGASIRSVQWRTLDLHPKPEVIMRVNVAPTSQFARPLEDRTEVHLQGVCRRIFGVKPRLDERRSGDFVLRAVTENPAGWRVSWLASSEGHVQSVQCHRLIRATGQPDLSSMALDLALQLRIAAEYLAQVGWEGSVHVNYQFQVSTETDFYVCWLRGQGFQSDTKAVLQANFGDVRTAALSELERPAPLAARILVPMLRGTFKVAGDIEELERSLEVSLAPYPGVGLPRGN